MQRKLSLLLAMVLAMTMVVGTAVTALADDYPYETIHVSSTEYSFDDISTMPVITLAEDELTSKHYLTRFYDSDGNWLYSYSGGSFKEDDFYSSLDPQPTNFSNVKYALICYQIYKRYVEGDTSTPIDASTTVADERSVQYGDLVLNCSKITSPGDLSKYQGYNNFYETTIFYQLAFENDGFVTDTEKSSPAAHTHNFRWQTITEPTKDADGLEGEVCSCGAVRNTQLLSAYGYSLNEYAAPMINAAKPGQTITFEFGEWNSFQKSFMAKLVDKSAQNVTFVFKYKWNHKVQTITIPAGTPIDLNFDWYGPAKMAELYGAY